MVYLAVGCLTIAPLFLGFLMEPWLPLGHWGWGVLLVLCLLPGAIQWRREIAGYITIRTARPRSLWRRFRSWIAGPRRLKGVPDLQKCLDELIKYSGFPVTTKVTSREIEASNTLFPYLQRASAIFDEQGESHPKIKKGLTVTNHTEWIEFLSKRLAQADAR